MDFSDSKHSEVDHCKCSKEIEECSGVESTVATSYEASPIIKHHEGGQCWKTSMIIKPKNSSQIKVFIVKRIGDDDSTEIAINIIRILNSFKTKVFVEENCIDEFKDKNTKQEVSFFGYKEEEEMEVDLLIIIGGDGSILWALQYFHNRITPPILAYSKGTLNYLCNFSIQHYEQSLKNVMESIVGGKPILIETRSRIHCEILNKENGKKRTLEALNEVALDRGCSPHIVKLNCYLEGKYFATFEGDGVLVATPTGSTAYQLSAGGPIMNHLMSSLAITPISPINLSTRPVVLPPKVKLTFQLHPDARKNAFLGADGQVKLEITKNHEVVLTGSQFYAPFILGENQDTLSNWITRLRDLLGWNRKFGGQGIQ
jgi:NAD kinase